MKLCGDSGNSEFMGLRTVGLELPTLESKHFIKIVKRGQILTLDKSCSFGHRIPQPEIGRLVGGIDYSGVSQARKRPHIKLENEPELKKEFVGLTDQLIKLSRLKI